MKGSREPQQELFVSEMYDANVTHSPLTYVSNGQQKKGHIQGR